MTTARIPRVLKNFNVFINGRGYAGLCDEAELPEIVLKMEEHRAGGMDGSYEIEMGQEAMSAKLTMAEYIPELIAALGNGVRVQLRGALVRDTDNNTVAVVVELGARPKKFGPGSWKAGDKGSAEHEFAVDYFRWNQAGEDLIEVDVVNMIRKVGGVDQLAAQRAALSL